LDAEISIALSPQRRTQAKKAGKAKGSRYSCGLMPDEAVEKPADAARRYRSYGPPFFLVAATVTGADRGDSSTPLDPGLHTTPHRPCFARISFSMLCTRRKLPRQADSSRVDILPRGASRDSALAAGFPAHRAV
jgi:hypothetical protein